MKLKALFAILILASCQTEVKINNSLLQHMPQNAALVVQINDFSKFQSEVKNNSFAASAKSLELFKDLFRKLDYVEFPISKTPIVLGLYEVGKSDFEFFLLTKDSMPEIAVGGVTNKTEEKIAYEKQSYTKYTLDGTTIFSMGNQKLNLISSSQLLLENFIRATPLTKPQRALEKLQRVADTSASANLYLNFEYANGILKKYLKNKDVDEISNFADWIGLDFSADQNQLNLTGICLASDSTRNIINLLKGDTPFASSLPTILPQGTKSLVSYALHDPKKFIQKQNTYLDRATSKDTLFTTIEEIGIAQINQQKAVVLNSFGAEALLEKLQPFTTTTTTYQNKEIYELATSDLLERNLKPLITEFPSNYYTIIANSFVFAEQ